MADRKLNTKTRNNNTVRTVKSLQDVHFNKNSVRDSNWFSGFRSYGDWESINLQPRLLGAETKTKNQSYGKRGLLNEEIRYFRKPIY